ncbi:MAG: hypothetical protein INQ03_07535 [Candidatus Heimdallarchaeota archaeon]|nr:hypothetical protein [Candidatus Heimdallarchaeota archaeon]
MKECKIDDCHRETDKELCQNHYLAKSNLEMGYEQWKKAYGSTFAYEDYLESILDPKTGAGDWVRDIAKAELNK